MGPSHLNLSSNSSLQHLFIFGPMAWYDRFACLDRTVEWRTTDTNPSHIQEERNTTVIAYRGAASDKGRELF